MYSIVRNASNNNFAKMTTTSKTKQTIRTDTLIVIAKLMEKVSSFPLLPKLKLFLQKPKTQGTIMFIMATKTLKLWLNWFWKRNEILWMNATVNTRTKTNLVTFKTQVSFKINCVFVFWIFSTIIFIYDNDWSSAVRNLKGK